MTNRKQRYRGKDYGRRRRLSLEALDVRRLLAGDWQNPRNALDVDDSGIASPLDALLVHFEFDSSAGLSAGRALGSYVVQALLNARQS